MSKTNRQWGSLRKRPRCGGSKNAPAPACRPPSRYTLPSPLTSRQGASLYNTGEQSLINDKTYRGSPCASSWDSASALPPWPPSSARRPCRRCRSCPCPGWKPVDQPLLCLPPIPSHRIEGAVSLPPPLRLQVRVAPALVCASRGTAEVRRTRLRAAATAGGLVRPGWPKVKSFSRRAFRHSYASSVCRKKEERGQ